MSLCHMSPQCPPNRFSDYFGSNLETSLKAKIEKRITRFCFFFESRLRWDLGWCWGCLARLCWCTKDPRNGKGYFSEMLVLHLESNCLQGLWDPFRGIRSEEKDNGLRSRVKLVCLLRDRWTIWGIHLGPQIIHKSIRISLVSWKGFKMENRH